MSTNMLSRRNPYIDRHLQELTTTGVVHRNLIPLQRHRPHSRTTNRINLRISRQTLEALPLVLYLFNDFHF